MSKTCIPGTSHFEYAIPMTRSQYPGILDKSTIKVCNESLYHHKLLWLPGVFANHLITAVLIFQDQYMPLDQVKDIKFFYQSYCSSP